MQYQPQQTDQKEGQRNNSVKMEYMEDRGRNSKKKCTQGKLEEQGATVG